jgi:hypothetical protein
MGGSRYISSSEEWDLAFIRISDPTTALSSTVTRILYDVFQCNAMNKPGYSDAETAPYVSHLGLMEDSITTGYQMMFGVTNGNNHDGNKPGFYTLVWRVPLDSNGDAVAGE